MYFFCSVVIFFQLLVIKALYPDRYSAYNAGYGSGWTECGSATLITGKYLLVMAWYWYWSDSSDIGPLRYRTNVVRFQIRKPLTQFSRTSPATKTVPTKDLTSVADPDWGTPDFWTPGSGVGKKNKDPDPGWTSRIGNTGFNMAKHGFWERSMI
jgi:hypothetical protein